MVSIEEIQAVYYMVAATGVLVAAVFYVLNMRATLQTRQAQLLMQIYDRVNNKDFTRNWAETNYFWKWADNEDYWKKYGANLEEYPKLKNVIDTYEGIGAILENKLVDPKMIYGVLRADPILYWEKFSPLMKEFAERAGESLMYPGFELLYDKMRRQYEIAHGFKFGHKIRHADDYLRSGGAQVQPP